MERSIETTVARRTARWVWTTRWCLPYESTFGRLNKYAWANLVNASEMASDLFGIRISSSLTILELLYGRWTKQCEIQVPRGLMARGGFISAYGVTWPQRLATGGPLRYCRLCLRDGFHSTLFQIEGLIKCPIHCEPLFTRCLQCEAPTFSLALHQTSFQGIPFQCKECQRPLAGLFDPRRWCVPDRAKEVRRALRPIVKWLKDLDAYPNGYSETPLAPLGLSGEFASESEKLVAFEIARQLMPLKLPQDQYAQVRRPLSYRFVQARQRSSYTSRNAIYKSIRKYLLRTYFPAHRHCLSAARLSMGGRLSGAFKCWDVCLPVAAFRRWYATYLRSVWCGLIAEKNEHDATDALFATKILADFYVCAAAAYVYNPDGTSGRRARWNYRTWLNDPLKPPGIFFDPIITLGEPVWTWKVQSDRDDEATYFVASGDASLLQRLEAFGRSKCVPSQRRQRRRQQRQSLKATNQLPEPVSAPLVPSLAQEDVQEIVAAHDGGSGPATPSQAYGPDWDVFVLWCQSVHQPALPATSHTVATFLGAFGRLGCDPITLDRRREVIRVAHIDAKVASPHDAPEVDEVLRGTRDAWHLQSAQANNVRAKLFENHAGNGLLKGSPGQARPKVLDAVAHTDV